MEKCQLGHSQVKAEAGSGYPLQAWREQVWEEEQAGIFNGKLKLHPPWEADEKHSILRSSLNTSLSRGS